MYLIQLRISELGQHEINRKAIKITLHSFFCVLRPHNLDSQHKSWAMHRFLPSSARCSSAALCFRAASPASLHVDRALACVLGPLWTRSSRALGLVSALSPALAFCPAAPSQDKASFLLCDRPSMFEDHRPAETPLSQVTRHDCKFLPFLGSPHLYSSVVSRVLPRTASTPHIDPSSPGLCRMLTRSRADYSCSKLQGAVHPGEMILASMARTKMLTFPGLLFIGNMVSTSLYQLPCTNPAFQARYTGSFLFLP